MRRLGATLAALILVAGLAGCGGADEGEDGAGNEPIQVTLENGDITPKGERVEVSTGTVTFEITADEPGSLHVHTSPEQAIEFESGTHTYEVTVKTPGLIEVEAHEPPIVVVQLEAK